MHPSPAAPHQISFLHRLWRLLPARERREFFTRATARFVSAIDCNPPLTRDGLVVAGDVSRPSGLGEGARLMGQAMGRLGLPHWMWDLDDPRCGARATDGQGDRAMPPGDVPLVLHVNAPMLPYTLLRLPSSLKRHRYIIGYWAWELPTVPREWRVGARFVHEVWVPSPFTAAAIEPLLPGRVRVVPHPLGLSPPRPPKLGRAVFDLAEDAVVVLVSINLASSFERKNPLAAVRAFRDAFGARQDRVLLLKVINADQYPDDFARIVAATGNAPNIRIDTTLYPTEINHELIDISDIVLSLHRGEGFGLVMAEGLLLGKAVVATGWSGNMVYMDPDSAALVAYRLVPPRDDRQVYYDGYWAEPDHDSAVAHLRHLADNPAARSALGSRGRARALATLGGGPLLAAMRGLGPHDVRATRPAPAAAVACQHT